ncbi:MAG TPA: cytochrome c-type biogenesis protein CcmH [Gaiellaceae bacterium]|nr:cytochrome c-type biogenesis protein CcmH [Gaiellaceae bacterium]
MKLVVVALAVLTLVWAPAAAASEEKPTRWELEQEVMCPDCNAPLAQSNGRQAQQLIHFIEARIAAGDTKSEIKDKLVAQYGPPILVTPPAPKKRATLADLEDEVMCPVCPGETLEQSRSPAAQQVERFISTRIAAGDSKNEIKDRLVAEYGTRILAAPPKEGFDLLAWVLPLVGLLGGALVVGGAAWHWSRRREPAQAGIPLDPELERRLDRELADLD